MSNITKNLFLALTIACVIAFVVFCVQMIVLNRGVEPRTPGSTTSGGSVQGDEEPEPDENEEELPVYEPTPRPPPQGTRHELLVADNTRLIIYAGDELFDFEQAALSWVFEYTRSGEAALEVRFTSITDQAISAQAEAFLNAYTGSTGSVFGGEQMIQGSTLTGFHTTLRHGGRMYEAWIHELENSDLSLVFIINYENDTQRDALYEILTSMDIE
jgi:hypothetical protein